MHQLEYLEDLDFDQDGALYKAIPHNFYLEAELNALNRIVSKGNWPCSPNLMNK